MRTAAATALLFLAATALAPARQQRPGFPHLRHEGLFPSCTGCHTGIETGDRAAYFPTPDRCANCHDGERRARVGWTPQPRPASNLKFSHVDHRRVSTAAGTPADCAACHQDAGASVRMAVSGPRPDRCIACHAHQAPEHLARTADCTRCHIPLQQAADLGKDRVAAFPRPSWHGDTTFILEHGAAATGGASASCAVCHARESCQRCHLNASRIPAIQALGEDARIASLVAGKAPSYPRPATHTAPSWGWEHGQSSDFATCANCHAQASCRTCHRDGETPQIDALPRAAAGGPTGVLLKASRRVHPGGWVKGHGSVAAATESTCASCHGRSFCVECHAGSTTPSFHPPDFLERHGPEAYGAETTCSSCHSAETFCRSCHKAVGLSSKGRMEVAFHSSQPLWLLGHGQAARQGLEGCVTCHTQADCAQCHSASSGWRINPHGANFDAQRMAARNRLLCIRCHRGGIPGG